MGEGALQSVLHPQDLADSAVVNRFPHHQLPPERIFVDVVVVVQGKDSQIRSTIY